MPHRPRVQTKGAEDRARGHVRMPPVHLRGYVVHQTVQQTTPPALGVLGAGSFGVVVKATRISDSEPVALKIMACRAFDGPDHSVVAARDEKATLNTIGHHPNITQLKGWEEINPTDAEVALSGPLMQGLEAWMVAERTNDPGRPLPGVRYANAHTFCIAALKIAGEKEVFELVLEQGRFSAQLLRPVTMQLADALKHVHSRGFGHFDVKAENIRITCSPEGDPEVTLVDFGLAVNLRSGEHPTQHGTLGIAAPEFFTGTFADVDSEKIGAADIFSLGVVVFTLAFGYPPWAKATADGLGERDRFNRTCAIDQHGRGFLKYANLGEPGRLSAYVQQIPAFKMHLTPPPTPQAASAPPAPTPMATGPTQPYDGEASQAPATGALVPPTVVPAPSDHRLIDLMSNMLQIDPAQRPTAQEILEHVWITTPVPAPVPAPEPEPAPPAQSLYASCGAGSDAEPQFRSCGASDEEPQFNSCGATAPASAAYRSLGDSAPPGMDLVLPKMTRTHAIVKEGWAFAE
jgi:serine/threonine protein kinase